jgi:3-oxoacyl-[acyl-carrier protein] reductase
MDLGLKGRKAIVCALSRGLGKACALALAREGCEVVINGLDPDRLKTAADEITAATGAKVARVRADITTEEGRLALVATCPDADILVNNNAGPKPAKLEDLSHEDFLAALEMNMLAPILLIKLVLPGMRKRKFGRIVNITSALVKSPRASDMGLSTSARTGLTAMCKSLSREVAADNVTLNNILPERIDTDRQKFMAERIMQSDNVTMEEARARIASTLPAKRFGRTEEFGDACAFLCSVNAGFITGQNLQLDGGGYQGLI